MIEPSLAFQTAVRAALIADPGVLALVPATGIRAGSTRPDRNPCVVLGNAQTIYLGRASGAQHLARVALTLHVWAHEDGADTARALGGHVLRVLLDTPTLEDGAALDDYSAPSIAFMRDPDPAQAWTHGVVELEAVLRWRV